MRSSGKLLLTDKLLAKLRAEGRKVLIFSQMLGMLDLLEELCNARGYSHERLDGSVQGNLRQAAIDRFSKPETGSFVFLLSTRAGGVGINLVAADTVIIYDSDWNPQNDAQAQARCHRIGQEKAVQVFRLVTKNTYEETMLDRASRKLGLEQVVLGEGVGGKNLSPEELERMLRLGAYHHLASDPAALEAMDAVSNAFCDEDIEKLLATRTRKVKVDALRGTVSLELTHNMTGGTATSSGSGAGAGAGTAGAGDANGESRPKIDDPEFWSKILPAEETADSLLARLNESSGVSELKTDDVKRLKYLKDVKYIVDEILKLRQEGEVVDEFRMDTTRQLLVQISNLPNVFGPAKCNEAQEWKNALDASRERRSRARGREAAQAAGALAEREDGLVGASAGAGARRGRKTTAANVVVEAGAGGGRGRGRGGRGGGRGGDVVGDGDVDAEMDLADNDDDDDDVFVAGKGKGGSKGGGGGKKKGGAAGAGGAATAVATANGASSEGTPVPETIPDDFMSEVCYKCQDGGDLIVCEGRCQRAFHVTCTPNGADVDNDEAWFCADCSRGRQTCMLCQQPGVETEEMVPKPGGGGSASGSAAAEGGGTADGEAPAPSGDFLVYKCSAKNCGRFYHAGCVDKAPRVTRNEDGSFVCPLHACAKCDAKQPGANVQCMRCANGFHAWCMDWAHTLRVRTHLCVCPDHLDGRKFARNTHTRFGSLAAPSGVVVSGGGGAGGGGGASKGGKKKGGAAAAAAATAAGANGESTSGAAAGGGDDDLVKVRRNKKGGENDPNRVMPLARGELKPDVFDDTATAERLNSSLCALCHTSGIKDVDGTDPKRAFLVPLKTGEIVHKWCADHSPRVVRAGAKKVYHNILSTVKSGARNNCVSCQKAGATVRCCADVACPAMYHVPCAESSGWDFKNLQEQRVFVCPEHRAAGASPSDDVVHARITRPGNFWGKAGKRKWTYAEELRMAASGGSAGAGAGASGERPAKRARKASSSSSPTKKGGEDDAAAAGGPAAAAGADEDVDGDAEGEGEGDADADADAEGADGEMEVDEDGDADEDEDGGGGAGSGGDDDDDADTAT